MNWRDDEKAVSDAVRQNANTESLNAAAIEIRQKERAERDQLRAELAEEKAAHQLSREAIQAYCDSENAMRDQFAAAQRTITTLHEDAKNTHERLGWAMSLIMDIANKRVGHGAAIAFVERLASGSPTMAPSSSPTTEVAGSGSSTGEAVCSCSPGECELRAVGLEWCRGGARCREYDAREPAAPESAPAVPFTGTCRVCGELVSDGREVHRACGQAPASAQGTGGWVPRDREAHARIDLLVDEMNDRSLDYARQHEALGKRVAAQERKLAEVVNRILAPAAPPQPAPVERRHAFVPCADDDCCKGQGCRVCRDHQPRSAAVHGNGDGNG